VGLIQEKKLKKAHKRKRRNLLKAKQVGESPKSYRPELSIWIQLLALNSA
jgi:hypothetical protein